MKKKLFLLILPMSIFIFSCKYKNQSNIICQPDVDYPLIEDSIAGKVMWVMSQWFDFYNINISDFKLINTTKINIESLKSDAETYLRKYSSNDDTFLPEVRDYSPDQKYHLNLLEATNVRQDRDGRWCLVDNKIDAQYVFLFDKADSTLLLAAMHDTNNFSDAAFWLDNTTFVLSGKRFLGKNENRYYFDIYNLADCRKDSYCFKDSLLLDDSKSYFKEINLKKRDVAVK